MLFFLGNVGIEYCYIERIVEKVKKKLMHESYSKTHQNFCLKFLLQLIRGVPQLLTGFARSIVEI